MADIIESGYNLVGVKELATTDTGGLDSFMTNLVDSTTSPSSFSGNTAVGSDLNSPNFKTGSTGWIIRQDGSVEFALGYFRGDITGATGTFSGTVTVGSLNIPDTTTVNSFHVDTTGNAWWGTNVATGYATAPASILKSGAATFSSVAITGGSVATATLNKGVMSFESNLVFSSSGNVVSWTSGVIKMQDGTTYTVSSGNTGTLSVLTYIYLDIATSITVLQITTTYSTSVGDGKILVCTAQNHTTGDASFIPTYGQQPFINGSDQIAALSITAGSIAANTITSNKMNVSQLSAISADLGSITAGSLTINSGVAVISSNGDATFKSIQVGGSTRQYTLTDSGIFSFGDGSDSNHTTTGDETLTSDKYYQNLTVATGHTLYPNGYRIFVQDTLTLAGTGKISGNGGDGGVGGNGVANTGGAGGAGGTAISDGYLKGCVVGANGGKGADSDTTNNTVGLDGTATTNSIGYDGSNGGAGGRGYTSSPGKAGGNGGTATASNVKLIANWHLATLLDVSSTGSTVKFNNSASGAGGGGGGAGGGAGGSGAGGGGGGAGTSGRIISIYARKIIIGASASISANGGNGGNGGNGITGGQYGGGGGGGGAGGNGGIIILVYNTFTNAGNLTVDAGTKGTGGLLGTGPFMNGLNGDDGTNGSAGTIYQFRLSL